MAKKRIRSAGVVERKDSHHQLSGEDMKPYLRQLEHMTGNTQLPAVLYKGTTVPRRVLSDFSYLTKG